MITVSRINRNIRSIKRYRTILGVLIKYGFGHVVEQLNIDYYVELGRKLVSFGKASKEIQRLSQPVRMRLAMEELGPTFIKLGQILSTRPDIIPKEYADEFGKLQDMVPAIGEAAIRSTIEEELGTPAEEAFASFSPRPIAAASMAQVHRGRLHDGSEVVIKVRRPGIGSIIETDLDILMGLAHLIQTHLTTGEIFDPVGIVKEFRRSINREMNFTREGHAIDRFATNFSEDSTVHVPYVHWDHCCEGVLTMEYVEGIKISSIDELTQKGFDLKTIARNGADAILKQVLIHGFFHGDPHPGNVFVLEDNCICFLDYGMVGRLDDDLKYQLADLLIAILDRDVDRVISQLLYSGELTEEVDIRQLKRDLSEFIDDYYEIPLLEINAGRMLMEFIDLLTHYRIKFPSDLMLLAKALITTEGVGRQLDPELSLIAHLKPFMEEILQQRLSPGNLSKEFFRVGTSYSALLKNFPRDLKEFLNRVNHNKFKINLEHRGFEKLISDLDKASNRISFSLLIASLIVGSSLIMQTDKGPMLFGFPILGFLGYSIAGLLGLWLAIAILRSGRL